MINAIVGHLVGDFLLQNDWMALNKKNRSWPCVVHCALWTLAVCAFAGWWNPASAAWLFLTHFAIDRTQFIKSWMRLNNQSAFAKEPLAPWSVIVVDQVFHVLTLWVVQEFPWGLK